VILEVVVDLSSDSLDKVFDYEGDARPGSRVLVEFGKALKEGFVVGVKDSSPIENLKPIKKILSGGIKPALLELCRFLCDKYNIRTVDALRLFFPVGLRGGKVGEIEKKFLYINPGLSDSDILKTLRKNAAKQIAAVAYLRSEGRAERAALNNMFGNAAINALVEKGLLLQDVSKKSRVPLAEVAGGEPDHIPTPTQSAAIDRINLAIEHPKRAPEVFLLHGVTGSGKTFVYMSAVEKALALGKTAIMLVPEISLTPQILRLMRSKFSDKVAILHSGLSAGERLDEWMRLYRGEAKIAVGARSALFAPLDDLGLIVIDEEHDPSYISESNPRYDAREAALFRAKNEGACLVFGSATPDIETYYKAERGEIELLELPERISEEGMPVMEIVDMAEEFRLGNPGIFSSAAKDALENVLARGEQAMVFLNRRGYSSFVVCRSCGHLAKCEDCDISLTYHKSENRLKCHYCGRRVAMIDRCPECGGTSLRLGRTGTEQIVEELKRLFPKARVLRMDNDTTSGKDAHYKILSAFGGGAADILVGTQMIAKGHDFSGVTLVVILDADFSLYFADYRSPERVFQLVTQVAGRAGRADKGGRVLLQTYSPRHYVFRYAKTYDYSGFYKKERNAREVTHFPPFSKIVRMLITSEDDEEAVSATKAAYTEIKMLGSEPFYYMQAMKSPVKRIERRFRYQILMRIKNLYFDEIIKTIYNITDGIRRKRVFCFVEINPQSLV
jgi:primosomal protein N' (replication factor Y)